MPTYEYECQKCGHEFERFQSMTEEPLKRCPKCKGKVVRKIGTGAGLLFKGSGFYISDYRSENYKKGATADKPASTSETKSDASSAKAAKDTKKPAKTAKKDA
ncbi:MAG: zinc ribbon domain-containing protein [Kiritimatiellae bacterium]|nr:zinc ribbon domain-containing protein [Kiritimatiellia bacterium]